MNVNLEVTVANEYATKQGFEDIDWEEENNPKCMPKNEGEAIQKILTCEVSIYLLRRSTGHCGSVVDNMFEIRRSFMEDYEQEFEKEYEDYNGENIY